MTTSDKSSPATAELPKGVSVPWLELPKGSLCSVAVKGETEARRLVVWPDGNAAWSPTSVPVFRPDARSKRQGPALVLARGLSNDQCTLVAELAPAGQDGLLRLFGLVLYTVPMAEAPQNAALVRLAPGPGPLTVIARSPWKKEQLVGVLVEELSEGERAALAACTSLSELADMIEATRLLKIGDDVPAARVPAHTYVRAADGREYLSLVDNLSFVALDDNDVCVTLPRTDKVRVLAVQLPEVTRRVMLDLPVILDTRRHARHRIAEGVFAELAKYTDEGVFAGPHGDLVSVVDGKVILARDGFGDRRVVRRLLGANHGFAAADLETVKTIPKLDALVRRRHRSSDGAWTACGERYVAERFSDSVRLWKVDCGFYPVCHAALINAVLLRDLGWLARHAGLRVWQPDANRRWVGGYRDETGSYRSAATFVDLLFSYVERPPSERAIRFGLTGDEDDDRRLDVLIAVGNETGTGWSGIRIDQARLPRLNVEVQYVMPNIGHAAGPVLVKLSAAPTTATLLVWKHLGDDAEAAAFAVQKCEGIGTLHAAASVRVVVVDLSRHVPVETGWK